MDTLKKWDLTAIASIPLIMTLGNSMLIPILPTIEKELHISAFQVSMIITIYSIVAIIMIPIAGFLSDRFGRKKIIIPGLIITGIGALIAGLASWLMEEPYWMILLGRFFQGVGAAGAFPIVLPLVGDMYKEESQISKGLGIIETSNTFGKVLSPIIGASLATVVWYLPFLAIPLLCLISVLLVIFLVKTPKKKEKPQRFQVFTRSIINIFKREGRWLYAIFTIGCVCMFVIFGVLFYLSEVLEQEHHIVGVYKGLVLAIPLAALCLASYISGKYIGENKKRMKWVSFFGILLLTMALFVCAFFDDLYVLITALFLSGAGIGAAMPSLDALITVGIEKEERGTITSIYSSMRFIGVAMGPPIMAILMKFSHATLFYVVAASSVIACVLALTAIKPPERTLSGGWKQY